MKTSVGIYTRPMSRWIRLAVMWLSLFAIPLHGMAGVTTIGCHSEGKMAASAPQGDGTHATSAAEPHADAMAAGGDGSRMPKAGCGANLICHAGVALLPARPDVAAASLAVAPPADTPSSVIHFLTGGPERPPRSASA